MEASVSSLRETPARPAFAAHALAFHLCVWIAAAGLSASALADQAVIAQGRQIAGQGVSQGVAACAGCHGANGEGSAAFPRLGGTGQAYLQAQLEAFANGSRKNVVMQPVAQGLSAAQRVAVATYYSSLPLPLLGVDATLPTPADAGAWMATRGRWTDQIPACAQCHGPGGNGVGVNFPPLAGLPSAYISEQLQAWKNDARPPGPLGLMESVAKRLSDADVNAVSTYYASLSAAAARAKSAAEKKRGGP